MAVHYPKRLYGRILRSELRPVTIDAGGGIVWQGGVTQQEQFDLIKLIETMIELHPERHLREIDETYGTWIVRLKAAGRPLPPSQDPVDGLTMPQIDPAFVTPPIPGMETEPAEQPAEPKKRRPGRPRGRQKPRKKVSV